MVPGRGLPMSVTWSLLLAAAALGGCVGGGDDDATELDAAPSAQFDEGMGGIEGVITDAEVRPVEGAEVVLPDLERTTLTDAAGQFAFSNVEPGTHMLAVVKLGYENYEQRVDVQAGQAATVQIQLVAVGVTEAFHATHSQRGLFGCGSSWNPGIPPEPGPGFRDIPGLADSGLPNRIGGIAGCGFLSDEAFNGTPVFGLDNFLLNWEVNHTTEDWQASVFEMEWQTNQLAGRGLNMVWEVEDCFNRPEFLFVRESGASPLRGVANQTQIQGVIANGTAAAEFCEEGAANCNEEGCKMTSRVFATEETTGSEDADVGVSFQQRYDLYHTFFFVDPAPEAFTALDEG